MPQSRLMMGSPTWARTDLLLLLVFMIVLSQWPSRPGTADIAEL